MPAPIPFRQPNLRGALRLSVQHMRHQAGLLLYARIALAGEKLTYAAECIKADYANGEPPDASRLAAISDALREAQLAVAQYGAAGSVGGNDG